MIKISDVRKLKNFFKIGKKKEKAVEVDVQKLEKDLTSKIKYEDKTIKEIKKTKLKLDKDEKDLRQKESKDTSILKIIKGKKDLKTWLKWIWWFIWESDSIWSWIVNIILAFVLIKFVVYPVIGLVLVTSHPIVAVVSGSMEHDGSFDDWWDSTARCGGLDCTQALHYKASNITKEDFREFSYKNGFNKGDIMILKGVKPEKIKVGDILVFKSIRPDPIIHRVVNVWKENGVFYFQTKGDHNLESYSTLDEDSIHQDRVIGKAVLRVPFLGWIKIAAVNIWSFIRG